MAQHDYTPIQGTKRQKYLNVIHSFTAIQDPHAHPLSLLSNLIALLKQQFNWWWVGLYLLKDDCLTLGPFQGPKACMRLFKGVGVCGTAWAHLTTLIVDDVDTFPGHIACSSASKSQIVVPIIYAGAFVGVLDIDSEKYSTFDKEDEEQLRVLLDVCSHCFQWVKEKW